MLHHSEYTIVIPSLNPDHRLITLVQECMKLGMTQILIVDDGSDALNHTIFEEIEALGASVLRHHKNLGKGRALKTAMQELLHQYGEEHIMITADSDGQHLPEDIQRVVQSTYEHPDALVLGSRDFHMANIPMRSRVGNRMTSFLMKLLCGFSIQDSQTGLRGFTLKNAKKFLDITGDRFEYEFHMLFYCKEHHIPMIEESIETIYMNENDSSHFQPLKDSYLIYRVFFRFLISSFASSILDILIFSFMILLLKDKTIAYIWWATVIARIVSSVFNFTVNKKSVFHDEQASILVPMKYFSLCIVQMCTSAWLVSLVFISTHMLESLCKIIVDVILFLISFVIQREWIFTDRRKRYENEA